jgi:hypothetical protein
VWQTDVCVWQTESHLTLDKAMNQNYFEPKTIFRLT